MAKMTKTIVSLVALLALVVPAYLLCVEPASAITVELAKKCRELAVKAHPTPKAGSKATGAEKAQRAAYQACLAKGDSSEKNSQEKK